MSFFEEMKSALEKSTTAGKSTIPDGLVSIDRPSTLLVRFTFSMS